MYSQYMIDNLNRQKDKIEDMIRNYQQPQPVNNFINALQQPSRDLLEWRVLNENEEIDNLYVNNKTLFINDNMMVIKDVDGKTEKWEVKKVYPIDKKDEKINQLEEEIRSLKEVLYEHSKSNKPAGDVEQPISTDDVDAEPKPKANGKSVPKQDNSGTSRRSSSYL